jgi:hypothetical protein
MPDWSPVRTFGGYHKQTADARSGQVERVAASACGCASGCGVHGHAHADAWGATVPVSDLRTFWGALGCSCWMV